MNKPNQRPNRPLNEPLKVRRDTARAIRAHKMSLGIGKNDPYPKCPGKAINKVREFEAAGDYTHSNPQHACRLCACSRTAGSGTDHLGTGLCYMHEKTVGPKMSERIEISHRNGLQQRNPSVYFSLDRFSNSVKRDAEIGRKRLGLMNELDVARGMVQQLISSFMAADQIRSALAEAGGDVEAATEMLEAEQDNLDSVETLQAAHRDMLFEYVSGRRVPMSDKTRIALQTKVMGEVRKIMETEAAFQSETNISQDSFRVWFGRFWQGLERLSADLDVKGFSSGKDVLDSFTQLIRMIGEPTRIGQKD